jgi:Resolvase, N terminal domain
VKIHSNVRPALYARVSSEQQVRDETIGSQLEALRQRIAADGLVLDEASCFLDEGISGAVLVRPALERLRDQAAAGLFDRLSVLCPDRLARSFAHQALLIEELQRAGVDVVFLNHAQHTIPPPRASSCSRSRESSLNLNVPRSTSATAGASCTRPAPARSASWAGRRSAPAPSIARPAGAPPGWR